MEWAEPRKSTPAPQNSTTPTPSPPSVRPRHDRGLQSLRRVPGPTAACPRGKEDEEVSAEGAAGALSCRPGPRVLLRQSSPSPAARLGPEAVGWLRAPPPSGRRPHGLRGRMWSAVPTARARRRYPNFCPYKFIFHFMIRVNLFAVGVADRARSQAWSGGARTSGCQRAGAVWCLKKGSERRGSCIYVYRGSCTHTHTTNVCVRACVRVCVCVCLCVCVGERWREKRTTMTRGMEDEEETKEDHGVGRQGEREEKRKAAAWAGAAASTPRPWSAGPGSGSRAGPF